MINFYRVILFVYRVLLFLSFLLIEGLFDLSAQNVSSFKISETPSLTISVKKFDNSHGLKQSMVSDFLFDRSHLMWVATGGGLHSFDGKGFRYFRTPRSIDDNIRDDEVMRNIAQDKDGNLYVSTSSSLLKFNPLLGIFTSIYSSQGSYPQLFAAYPEGYPIIRIPESGFCTVNKSGNIVPLEKVNQTVPVGFLPHCWVSDTLRDQLFIGGDLGLVIIENVSDLDSLKVKVFKQTSPVDALSVDSKGCILFASESVLYQQDVKGIQERIGSLGNRKAKMLFFDKQGTLWLSTIDSRLYCSSDLKNFSRVEVLITSEDEKLKAFFNTIISDRDGNLWLGTDSDGLILYSQTALWFKRAELSFVRAIEKDKEGVLVASNEKGLLHVSNDCQVVQPFVLGARPDKELIFDLSLDDYGSLWLLSPSGLWCKSSSGVTSNIKSIAMTSGKILVNQGDTLMLTDGKHIHCYRKSNKRISMESLWSVKFPEVTCFSKSGKYTFIGTRFGLYLVTTIDDLKDRSFFSSHKPLINANIQSLIRTSMGVWVLTWNGLRLIDENGQKKKLPAYLKVLEDEVLYESLQDDSKRLWFTSNNGIICVDFKNGRFVRFGMENNIQSLEFNRNSSLKVGKNIWFGGIKGVNSIDPEAVFRTVKAPVPTLVSLTVADSLYTIGTPYSIPLIRLNYRNGSIEGQVSNYDYLLPNAQTYSFWLVNYDAGWSKPGKDGLFRYRGLPPGRFTMLAKSWDGLNTPGKVVRIFEVVVEPAFWQTVWFQILLMVSIIILVSLIVRRVQRVRYINRIALLEAADSVNRERLRIARDMHDDIGAGLTRISMLSRFINRDRLGDEKFKQKMTEVGEIADHLVDEMGEIIWAMNPKNDSLAMFVAHIRHYLGNYFSDSSIKLSFEVKEQIPDLRLSSDIKRNVYLCLKEISHNTLKHSGATKADLAIDFEPNYLSLQWCDNGCGFDLKDKLGKGNGLGNLKKRMSEIEGEIDFISGCDKGCCIVMKVKVAR